MQFSSSYFSWTQHCNIYCKSWIVVFTYLHMGLLFEIPIITCHFSCSTQTITHTNTPGRVAQSVACLATDASLTEDPGVVSSIPGRSHTFVEIDHEIISTVILLPSAESFKKGCCQLQAKVCAQSTVQTCQGKSVVR